MTHLANVLEATGDTPLVRLNRVTEGIDATVLVKLEYFNPGGSVKDRMAIYMVEEAERKGLLKPGGTIVENTSGNTGIALALYAVVRDYRLIVTIPDKMSDEKIGLLKALGAEVTICPTAVPADSPESYYETAKRIAAETPNSFMLNQYHNPSNVDAHFATTGPEIWEQTAGKIDVLVAGVGTGGTASGAGKFLKERNPDVRVVGVDPEGSVYYDWFKRKELVEPHVYAVEGIGEDMLCETMRFEVMDDMRKVGDREAFLMARRLAREEGILAGGSSGAAVHAAIDVARELPADKIVVVILPDSGYNYLGRIFNDDWMREKGFI